MLPIISINLNKYQLTMQTITKSVKTSIRISTPKYYCELSAINSEWRCEEMIMFSYPMVLSSRIIIRKDAEFIEPFSVFSADMGREHVFEIDDTRPFEYYEYLCDNCNINKDDINEYYIFLSEHPDVILKMYDMTDEAYISMMGMMSVSSAVRGYWDEAGNDRVSFQESMLVLLDIVEFHINQYGKLDLRGCTTLKELAKNCLRD